MRTTGAEPLLTPTADTLTSTSTVTDHTHFASAGITSPFVGQYHQRPGHRLVQPAALLLLRGLKLHRYYKARGSKTRHAYRTTTIGRSGFFQFSVAKSYGYYFKVVFPAQGAFQSCTSGTL